MGLLPLRVLPSKTAIVPVKKELMPSSQVRLYPIMSMIHPHLAQPTYIYDYECPCPEPPVL